jgi:hypothetical protein
LLLVRNNLCTKIQFVKMLFEKENKKKRGKNPSQPSPLPGLLATPASAQRAA